MLDVHAFLVRRLTGRWITSLASADPMGIIDMARGTWAAELMQQIGLNPAQYVELAAPGSILGTLSAEAAAQTGLPETLPVVAGAGDGQSAGLGANITGPGRAYLNLGTAVVSGAYGETYIADRAFRTLCAPLPGAFYFEEVLSGGTFTVSWFVEHYAADLKGNAQSVEMQLEAMAANVPPGALGLMLVPYWNAVLSPYWDANASGITIGWTGAHRREHFYRAILEGIAFEHRLVMEGVERATQTPILEYIVMGGGSQSNLWCQIIADVTGRRVTRASTTEATNLGAGILAAAAAGWYPDVRAAAAAMTATEESFDPVPQTQALYDRLFREIYQDLYPTLRELLARLKKLAAG